MRDSEKLAFPQSPKNLEKVFKVELTGMLISLRCYRLNKLHFMRNVKKMLGLAWFRPSTSRFSSSPFHEITLCFLTSISSNRQTE